VSVPKKIGERKIDLAASGEWDSVPGKLTRWQVSTQRNIITLVYNRFDGIFALHKDLGTLEKAIVIRLTISNG
jgi:hypothetical protein